MKTDNPLGPDTVKTVDPPRGAGGGIVPPLSGYKTYIVALATFAYGLFLAWANKHGSTGLADWLTNNKDTVLLILAAGLASTGRAAIAKVFDLLKFMHSGN